MKTGRTEADSAAPMTEEARPTAHGGRPEPMLVWAPSRGPLPEGFRPAFDQGHWSISGGGKGPEFCGRPTCASAITPARGGGGSNSLRMDRRRRKRRHTDEKRDAQLWIGRGCMATTDVRRVPAQAKAQFVHGRPHRTASPTVFEDPDTAKTCLGTSGG